MSGRNFSTDPNNLGSSVKSNSLNRFNSKTNETSSRYEFPMSSSGGQKLIAATPPTAINFQQNSILSPSKNKFLTQLVKFKPEKAIEIKTMSSGKQENDRRRK